ncbi:hypothetical protein TNCV_4848871 [Trichonephila clavipes]|nr:hypothetical protein TNCV_4848871 [Trichonephila clavipes]
MDFQLPFTDAPGVLTRPSLNVPRLIRLPPEPSFITPYVIGEGIVPYEVMRDLILPEILSHYPELTLKYYDTLLLCFLHLCKRRHPHHWKLIPPSKTKILPYQLKRPCWGRGLGSDTFKAEKDVLKYERDVLKSERDVLKSERDVLKSERDTFKAERDNLLLKNCELRMVINVTQMLSDSLQK